MGHALLLALTAAALAETYLLARLVDREQPRAACLLFAAVAAMAELVIVVQATLVLGVLAPAGLAVAVALALSVQGALILAWWLRRAPAPLPPSSVDGLLWLVGLAVSLQAVAYGAPTFHHDGMTYHLTFAVEWLQRGDLDAPFQAHGDLSAPFYPINSSLLYLWAMALPGSDFWARLVQAPFVVVVATAVLSLSKSLGARLPGQIAAVAALATVPILRVAHRDHGNDVIVAALLLGALAFLVEIGRTGSPLALAGAPLAIALAAGSKLVALAYLPLPVAAYVWLVWRRRAWRWLGWLASCLIGLASFSYGKNWYVTGSALYPASFGVPGFRARDVLRDPFQHSYGTLCHSYGELADVFGVAWGVVVAGAAVACAIALRADATAGHAATGELPPVVDTGLRGTQSLLVASAALSVAAFYAVVPYRHCRLLLFPFLALVPILACGVGRLVLDAPWLTALERALGRSVKPVSALACAILLASAVRIPAYERDKYDAWAARRVAGQRYGAGWRDLAARARVAGPLRVAMSATQNVPYPLYGPAFSNRVFYVPRDGREESLRYHLASRELYPFHRISEFEWRRAIRQLRPTHFFSAVDMDGLGFGQEDAWAAKDPATFALVYQDAEVRIYEVRLS
jgi:hypothetical protein